MTKPPTKTRVLTRIRIDEVSAVDKGAGEGVKIMLMKRAPDSADTDHVDLSPAEIARAKIEGYQALRHAEERFLKEEGTGYADHTPEDDPSRFLFSKETFLRKSYAADARGDEADRHDEETSADELVGGGNDHHASKVADLLVESGKHPDRQAALDHLLHTARGQALLRRMHKQHEDQPTMSTTPEQKLSDLVKRAGITAIAAQIVKSDSAFSIDEHELTRLTIEHAKREHPQLTDAQAFAKVYSAQDEGGVILRKAFNVVKAAGAAPYFDLKPQFVGGEDALDVDDPSKAIAQLRELGRQKWPTESEERQFLNAFTDPANAELARRAYRRPAATTVYPFPK